MVAERVYFSTARYTETKVYKKPIRTKLKYIFNAFYGKFCHQNYRLLYLETRDQGYRRRNHECPIEQPKPRINGTSMDKDTLRLESCY